MTIRFDDSLPALAEVIAQELGETALMQGVALRDGSGRLAFFADQPLAADRIERVADRLRQRLGAYARDDRVLAGCDDFGARRILADPNRMRVEVGEYRLSLLDRRMVGADWLTKPSERCAPPPRFVFASLKGGVGRSTAIAVTASDLASRGYRVLVVDLDLEAPGLGAMLLDEGTLPDFGSLDALVENGLSGLDDAFLADLIGPSALAQGRGRVDVMPAFGRRALAHPADVLAKIARAYTEDIVADGQPLSFRSQVVDLIDRFSDPDRYDVLLIDARAGLHESTAAAFLGLGAEVLLFGLDEPQTFQGFRALFAHLAHFIDPQESTPDWLARVTLVQGKATRADEEQDAFRERCRQMANETGLIRSDVAPSALRLPAEPFGDVPWDEDISDDTLFAGTDEIFGTTVYVRDDSNFRGFDPFARRDLLFEKNYSETFNSLLDLIRDSMASAREPEPGTAARTQS